jgi:hypothetical protein
MSRYAAWFPLRRGEVHRDADVPASAILSTGCHGGAGRDVLQVRRGVGVPGVDVPHERHVHARSDSRSVSFFDPHAEQVLDEA